MQMLRVIESDRNSTINSKDTSDIQALTNVKIIVDSLVVIGSFTMALSPFQLYVNYFETPFLKNTSKYYTIESTSSINTLSISQFMQRAVARLASESERIKFSA